MDVDNFNIGSTVVSTFTQAFGEHVIVGSALGIGNNSTYNLAGGSLDVKDILMGMGSTLHIDEGTLSLLTGGTVNLGHGGTLSAVTSTDMVMSSGSYLKGSGTLKNIDFTIGAGMFQSPGNSPGTQTIDGGTETWAGGGSYIVEIANSLGTAGTDWDLVRLINGGTLNITATSENPFNLDIRYIGLEPFVPSVGYTWMIVDDADGSISGFDPSVFNVTVTGFGAGVTAGQFTTAQGSMNLSFTPSASGSEVPEPSSMIVIGLAAAGLLGKKLRRKKK
jgi:hypothetical protein